jgi:hypothetical protein
LAAAGVEKKDIIRDMKSFLSLSAFGVANFRRKKHHSMIVRTTMAIQRNKSNLYFGSALLALGWREVPEDYCYRGDYRVNVYLS